MIAGARMVVDPEDALLALCVVRASITMGLFNGKGSDLLTGRKLVTLANREVVGLVPDRTLDGLLPVFSGGTDTDLM